MVDDGIRTDEVQSTSNSSGLILVRVAWDWQRPRQRGGDLERGCDVVVLVGRPSPHVQVRVGNTSVLRKRWSFVKCNQGIAVSKDLVCQTRRVFHDDAGSDMHFPPQGKCQKVALETSSSCSLGDTSGLRVPLTKPNTMPKIGTHALDVLGRVPCRQVPALPAAAKTVSSCTIPDKRRSESSLKIARRSSTWSNMWDGIGHVQSVRLSSSRKRCTRGHPSRIGCRSTPKRCRVCRTKCLQNEVGGTSGKLEEYESTKTVQVAARETRRRRSTRSRHACSADGGPSRRNK